MSTPPLSLAQVVAFLRDVIRGCRAQAACEHVPAFARARVRDAADQVEFFLEHRALRRAFFEARRATALHGAIDHFLRSASDATDALRRECGPP